MIRDVRVEDTHALTELWKEAGYGFMLPNFTSPLCIVKKVREMDCGIVGFGSLRITCEAIVACVGTPRQRLETIQALQAEVLRAGWEQGIDDVVAVMHPGTSDRWLTRLGWQKDKPWPMYSRKTENA